MDGKNNGDLYARLKRLDTMDKEVLMGDLKEQYIPKLKKTLSQKLTENIKSGVVVGMVNLPMCISFAVASGSFPDAGVLSGIYGGIFGGLIGGSYYNVLGPAGAMCGFLAKFVSEWGPDALPWCALFSGLFAFLVFFFNLGKYIDTLPVAVNEGFTLGVAFSIFFGQMSNALGIKLPKHEGKHEENVIDIIGNNLYHINEMNGNAFGVFVLFFLFLFIMSRLIPKIPWIVVVNILGIIIGFLDSIDAIQFGLILLKNKFDVSFKLFIMPKIPDEHPFMLIDPGFYVSCLPVAFVIVLECLIAAKIADSVTNTKFNIQRELKGLFITNLVIGPLGGFPSTAALPRTALNVKSGATHKYSSLISSIVLLIMSLIFMPFFRYLPMAVIAAQMCFISVRMINTDEVIEMFKEDKKNFNLFIIVTIISVVSDPIYGVFFGLLLYQIIFSEQLLNPYSEVIVTQDILGDVKKSAENIKQHFRDIPTKPGKYIVYRFVGVINFMNIGVHKERILSLARSDDSILCLSLRYLNISDVNAVEALKVLIDEIESNEIKHKIPKNYQGEFMEDGEIVKPEIEDLQPEEQEIENLYAGRKVLVTGITQSKYDKFKDTHWFKYLRNKNQLLISDDIKIDIGNYH